MKGNSNKFICFERADSWCKSVANACESILESGTEKVKVSTAGKNRYHTERQVYECLQLGWQRGYETSVPSLGWGFDHCINLTFPLRP